MRRVLGRTVRRKLVPSFVVLCLLLVVGDLLVGSWVEQRVADRLGCRLGVTDGADIEVSGWPRSASLLTGTVPSVRVSAPEARLTDQLDGDLAVELHDVRRADGELTTGGGQLDLTVAWSAVEARLDRPGVALSGSDGSVVAEVETGLVPVAILASPRVSDGHLALEPTAVRIGSRELSGALAGRLAARLGDRGDVLGEGLELPTPPRMTLTGARGTAHGLALTLDLAPGALGAGLGRGRC